MAGDPTIQDLGVFDADGFTLIHTDSSKLAFKVDTRPRLSLLLEGNVLRQGLVLLGPARAFEERVPLEAAGRRFGEVRVGISTTLMRYELLSTLRTGLWVAGAALLLAIVMALVFAQLLSARVRTVMTGLERFREGEFGYRLAVEGQDELALLASSINALGERLQARALSGAIDPTELMVATGQLSTWARVVSGLAHELADPIHAAGLHLGRLKTKVKDPSPQAARHFKVLEDELQRIKDIVHGFRRFTVLGELRAQWFDLHALLEEVAVRFSEDIGRNITVRLDITAAPRRFWGDAALLRQALANLMSNAEQAMPGGGSVALALGMVEDAIEITVTDEGIGIPEEIQSRIFDHSFTTKEGGSGIGLAVVQQVIKLHGGRIRLRSKPGEGTSVTLELPVRIPEPVTVG
jgi:signal transduction histidine kinase